MRVSRLLTQKRFIVLLLVVSVVAIALAWVGVPVEYPIPADQIEKGKTQENIYSYRVRWRGWPLKLAADKTDVLGDYTLYENDRALKSPHSSVASMAEHGLGRHTLWRHRLYFSTSDNTDPRSNGRSYLLATRAYLPPLVTLLTVTLFLLPVLIYIVRMLADDHVEVKRRNRIARASMIFVGLIDITMLLACAFAPNATLDITPELVSQEPGHAFEFTTALRLPVVFKLMAKPAGLLRFERTVFEDGDKLGPRNALPQYVRDTGGGANRFIDNRLLFSSSDNLDPRTNGRAYRVEVHGQLTPLALFLLGGSPLVLLLYQAPGRLGSTRAMGLLNSYLELVILASSGWVIALALVNYARLPSDWLAFLVPALLMPMLAAAAPGWLRTIRAMRDANAVDRWLLSGVAFTGCLLVALMLLTSRPDLDDVGLLEIALKDAASLGEPLSWRPWDNPVPGAQKLIEIQGLSKYPTYDALAAFAGRVSGVHPLTFYHNVFPVVGTVTWLVVYVLLLGHLGVRGRWLWPALASMTLMLLFDAATHHSFGNTWLLRIWQGKILVWAVLVPTMSLLTLRLFAQGDRRTVTILFLVLACGPFVNRSALVLLPGTLTAMAVAYAVVYRGIPKRRTYSIARFAPALLPVLLLAATVAAWALLRAEFGGAGSETWFARWRAASPPERLTESTAAFDTMRLAILPTTAVVVRDLTFLLIVPVLALTGRVRWLLPAFSLTLILLFFAPPLAVLWHDLMSNLGYWRLYYSLPLPLSFALLPLCLPRRLPAQWSDYGRLVVVALIVSSVVQAYVRPVISTDNQVDFKQPGQYRFPPMVRAFVDDAAALIIEHRSVLAPTEVASAIGLIYSEHVHLPYLRADHTSSTAVSADQLLRYCRPHQDAFKAVEHYVRLGADAIVIRQCEPAVLKHFQQALSGLRLEEIFRGHGYLIYSIIAAQPLE